MTGKRHEGDLESYNEEFLRCRGLRNHTWAFQTDFNVATNIRGRIIEFTKKLHCMACTTERHDTYEVSKTGRFSLKGRAYHYADGYQVHRGNPIATDEARDALLVRELRSSLDAEMANRLLNMRPAARKQPLLKVVGG